MLINSAELYIPESTNHGDRISLLKHISAIQLVPAQDGHAKLGLLSQLAPGTIVEVCGNGFNERTVKVRSSNQYYFVFLEDLNSQPSASAG